MGQNHIVRATLSTFLRACCADQMDRFRGRRDPLIIGGKRQLLLRFSPVERHEGLWGCGADG